MVLPGGAFPAIRGLDFLQKTQMLADVATREYDFKFAPGIRGKFSEWGRVRTECPFLQSLLEEASHSWAISEIGGGS
jgi:hypothetical protein